MATMGPRWVAVALLALLAVAAASSGRDDRQGALEARDEAAEKDKVDFSESVIPNAEGGGETQDREWNDEGDDPSKPMGGTSILLSNRNQMDPVVPWKEGTVQDEIAAADAPQTAAQKADEATAVQQQETARKNCKAPALHNMYYSFRVAGQGDKYLIVPYTNGTKTVFGRVGEATNDEDKRAATFMLVPGLASPSFVSFQSLTNPTVYLRHQFWRLVASTYRDTDAFRNTATFKLERGLAQCDEGYVSFEGNSPGTYIQVGTRGPQENGLALVRGVYDSESRTAASFKPVKPLAQAYWSYPGGNFKPQKSHTLASHADLNAADQYTMMFWVKPVTTAPDWTVVLNKGDSDQERAPAVWFYPGSTRLHIRSSTVSSYDSGADPAPELPTGQWTHVAFTHGYDGDLRIYYNGRFAFDSKIGTPKPNTGYLWSSDPFHNPANCFVGDLRYYPRVASADEIVQAYKQRKYRDPLRQMLAKKSA